MAGLERGRREALHEQLATQLSEAIRGLDEGTGLPSEAELIRQYGVSRTTVRHALAELADRGLVVRHQGRGTFVAPRRVAQSLADLGGFVDAFTEHGIDVESRLVGFGWLDRYEGVDPGVGGEASGALVFRRHYVVEGVCWAVADGVVLEPYGSVLSRADLEQHPSYELLHQRFGAIASSRVAVSCAQAPDDIAAELGLDGGWSMVLRRSLSDADGNAVQHTTYHLAPDRFEFTLTEARTGGDAPVPPPRLRLVESTRPGLR